MARYDTRFSLHTMQENECQMNHHSQQNKAVAAVLNPITTWGYLNLKLI